MATEKEAQKMRARVSEELQRLGAWGVSVSSGKRFGVRGSVIRALVEPGFRGHLPEEVSRTIEGKSIKVPVKVEEEERMKPESL